jgi:hypothetical protein
MKKEYPEENYLAVKVNAKRKVNLSAVPSADSEKS